MLKRLSPLLQAAVVLVPLLGTAGLANAQGYPMAAPPPPPAEMMPAPPPGPMVWHPGRWRWDGRTYVWVGGRYVRGPRPGAIWVTGHWAPRGGRWVWVRGHYRR